MSIAFADDVCMKNTKLKNLDVLYLKICKRSVANFVDMLCIMPCLAPVPEFAQNYVVDILI
jgi:hypothetical protein